MTTKSKSAIQVDPRAIAFTALRLTKDDLLPAALIYIWSSENGELESLKIEIDKTIEQNGQVPF